MRKFIEGGRKYVKQLTLKKQKTWCLQELEKIPFDSKKQLKYLGILVTATNNFRMELRKIPQTETSCYQSGIQVSEFLVFVGNTEIMVDDYRAGIIVWLWSLVPNSSNEVKF